MTESTSDRSPPIYSVEDDNNLTTSPGALFPRREYSHIIAHTSPSRSWDCWREMAVLLFADPREDVVFQFSGFTLLTAATYSSSS